MWLIDLIDVVLEVNVMGLFVLRIVVTPLLGCSEGVILLLDRFEGVVIGRWSEG